MTYQPATLTDNSSTLPKLPGWTIPKSGEASQNIAFLSGASFATLDVVLQQSGDTIPRKLLANTLALKAAVATSKLEGRLARETDIRDAYHLTPPGADGVRHWGPDGDVLAFWRDAGRIRLGGSDWMQNVTDHGDTKFDETVEGWLTDAMEQSKTLGPLSAATHLLRVVLSVDDRAERIACLFSDVVLAKFFGWKYPLPLTALHLTKANLRELKDGAGETAIQNAITKSAQTAHPLATTLAARAAALQAVAPKLRAKGSDAAIDLFLTEDAVAPSSMLSPMIRGTSTPMTGRAARRLCDRLIELGVGQRTDRPFHLPALWGGTMSAAAKQQAGNGSGTVDRILDQDLSDLPENLQWREWMGRVEAVLFASAAPVGREELTRVVGQGVSIDRLIDDIQAELNGRPYELVQVTGGWMFRTKTQFADAIKAATDLRNHTMAFNEMEMAVLCAVAYHQPIDRAGLADIFGKEVSRDLLSRLRHKGLIASGPRSPRPGAPHTFVTTAEFLATFNLQTLRDLPELDLTAGEVVS